MRISTIAGILLAASVLSGCYSREPLRTVTPEPRTRIVATVTDTGAVLMGNAIGPGAIEMEGLINAASPEEWAVHLVRVEHRDGRQVSWNRELVTFPRAALSGVQVVELDRTRSWIAAGGMVVGAVLLGRGFGLLFGGDDEGRGPPGPPPQELIGRGRR